MNLQHQCIPLCSHFPQKVKYPNECLFQERDVTLGVLYVGNMPLVGCSSLAKLWHPLVLLSFSLLLSLTPATSSTVWDTVYSSGGLYWQWWYCAVIGRIRAHQIIALSLDAQSMICLFAYFKAAVIWLSMKGQSPGLAGWETE